MSGTLTVSGNEITDLMRASALAWTAATSGGGSVDPYQADSSFGIWEGYTNLFRRGQCDATTDFNAAGAVVAVDATVVPPYSTQSIKVTTAGGSTGQGVSLQSNTGQAAAAGQFGAGAVYLSGVPGASYDLNVRWLNTDATQTDGTILTFNAGTGAFPTVTAHGVTWEVITPAAVAVAVGKTGDKLALRVLTHTNRVETFWVAHGIVKKGTLPLAPPYIPTSGGATAFRSAADVRAPSNLVGVTQGWAAIRMRLPWAGASAPNGFLNAFGWTSTGSDEYSLFLRQSTAKWEFKISSLTGGTRPQIAATHSAGGFVTLVARWSATDYAISVNGSAFVSGSVPPTFPIDSMNSTFTIGSSGFDTNFLNGNVMWFACGTGTLTDADALRIHTNWASYLTPEDVNGSNAAAAVVACTAVMPFDTAAYEDETFVIMDPDGSGASRGLVPRLRVDADVTTQPTTGTRVWTDITRNVRQLQFARSGRSDERQRTEVGSLTAVVSNRGGAVTALGIKKSQWIRVRGRWNGVNYPRWQGIFESLPRRWPSAGKDDLYELRAAGTLKTFNFCDLGGQTFPQQRNDQRFAAIAAIAIITTGSVDTNTDTADAVAAPYGEGTDALSTIQEIEASENGLIVEDPAGTVSFQGRHWRLVNSITPKGTIGDTAGQIPYRDSVSYEDDDQLIANIASVTPNGGTAVVVADTSSQGNYWPRKISRTLLTSDPTIAQNAAEYLVARYADPSPRIPQVEIPLAKVPTNLKAVVLAANNSDRFTFQRSAPTTIVEDYYVEKVGEKITPGVSWAVTFQMSPADREFGWILGDAVYGVLGSTTRLSY